jgi:integrase/recombinase XerD
MKQIILVPVVHRDEKRLLVKFPYDSELVSIIRKIEGSTFSNTHKSWHVANNPEKLKELFIVFNGFASLDTTAVFDKIPFLTEKKPIVKLEPRDYDKKNENNSEVRVQNAELKGETGTGRECDKGKVQEDEINLSAFHMLDDAKRYDVLKFKYWLRQKRYSDRTIENYIKVLSVFLNFCKKPVNKVNNKDILIFNTEYILERKLSFAYQGMTVSAVKLFFSRILDRELIIEAIERPRREHKLPNVLSKQEVAAILRAPKNIKHKTMLSVIYSCALRRSELLNLKPADVDSKRNLLIIRNAKGYKDRVVPLSDKTIEMMRTYYKEYKPKTWLFEGLHVGEKYSEESLACVLKTSLSLTKIKKPVSLHWLRHSCATHMLENGVDLRYIQVILGHKSSKTTEIYTHVTNRSLQKIKSPFDDLDLE